MSEGGKLAVRHTDIHFLIVIDRRLPVNGTWHIWCIVAAVIFSIHYCPQSSVDTVPTFPGSIASLFLPLIFWHCFRPILRPELRGLDCSPLSAHSGWY